MPSERKYDFCTYRAKIKHKNNLRSASITELAAFSGEVPKLTYVSTSPHSDSASDSQTRLMFRISLEDFENRVPGENPYPGMLWIHPETPGDAGSLTR